MTSSGDTDMRRKRRETGAAPILHRDDPDKDPLVGHVKVTRDDWLNMARDTLVHQGIDAVKILALADRLGVSRSSFYWYFGNRADLLAALLGHWQTRNTAQIVAYCERPAATISGAVCNFFRCFIDPAIFDRRLDFAVRAWARHDTDVRAAMDRADRTRLAALTAMFARHGYAPEDADARARILYFMQLGYHALEVDEPMRTRMSRIAPYLRGFTGVEAEPETITAFLDFARGLDLP
ncbi:MAG: TetR/AcrR family transcriptional regulator [Rhodobacteraceae bacterium]|nr:TetR/AcrR family transcriptional regulator [Paracoccaceae bacterium]